MKRLVIGLAASILIAGLSSLTPAGAAEYKTFHGYLYSMLNAINTKDEEPVYYLQTFDNRDMLVMKNASKKNEDPHLQAYVGKKVTIEGTQVNEGTIDYRRVTEYQPD